MKEERISEWILKLRRIGRKIDSVEFERIDTQKFRADLYEGGAFIESMIFHCREDDVEGIKAQIEDASKENQV